jgi:putative FmdB family regulatory protein
MPTYNYFCKKCEYCFEEILKMDDRHAPTESPCPNCSAKNSISLEMAAPALLSPFRVDGLKRPPTQFREKMQKIKSELPPRLRKNIKDY